MAEVAEANNPFAQFVIPDTKPEGPEEPNPFAQFVQPDEPHPQPERPSGFREPSRVMMITPEGFPVFENEEDNRAARAAVAQVFKGIPLGVAQGIYNIPVSIEQMGGRAMEAVLPEGSRAKKFMTEQRENVDRGLAQERKAYEEAGGDKPGAQIGEFLGNAAGTAPIAAMIPGGAAVGMIPRIAGAAIGGAASGALEPVNEPGNDFWRQKAEQAGAGAAGGAVAAPVAGALGRVISPNVSPEVHRLMEAGVRPTPGQIMGGVANRLEEAAQSIPFVGDAIKAARGRAVEDLNRAAINRSLEPIGAQLHPDVPMGREAIDAMHHTITENYNQLVPHLNVQADPQFINDLWQLNTMRARLPAPRQEELDRILQHDVFHYFDPQGRMTGRDFKQVEGELGRQARTYGTSTVAAERNIGDIFGRLQQHMRDMLSRSNPDHAAELQAANEAFTHKLRVERAAAATGSDQGIFTPAQLLQAVKGLDPSMRKGAFARGDALMQELADAGKHVLGNKVPDSGTPLRSAVGGAAILGPLYAWNPMAAGGVAAGGAGVMGAYSRPGVSALARVLAQRGPAAPAIAGAVRWPGNVSLPAILAAQQTASQQNP